MYFNTKGTKGGSQALKNVLTYYQDSRETNAVDDTTRKLHSYVAQAKNPELEGFYMTLGEKLDRENAKLIRETTEKVTTEVTENDMYKFLDFLFKNNYDKSSATSIICDAYPNYKDQYTAYINEHWL